MTMLGDIVDTIIWLLYKGDKKDLFKYQVLVPW